MALYTVELTVKIKVLGYEDEETLEHAQELHEADVMGRFPSNYIVEKVE